MRTFFLPVTWILASACSIMGQDPPRLVINEVSAFGDYEDWIEIANFDTDPTQEMELSIHDRIEKTGGNEFPVCLPPLLPGDKVVIVLPNFLNSNGEEVALYDPEGRLLDSVTYGGQSYNLTFGRLANAPAHWSYQLPTPGYENSLNPPPEETIPSWRSAPRPILALAGVYHERPCSLRWDNRCT